MFHYRKTYKRYKSIPKSTSCQFCDPEIVNRALATTSHSYVVPNKVFYDVWEMRGVTEHLMVIPKRHVLSLQELTPEERSDIMDTIADYEAKGYNIYARAPQNTQRSVAHQHTHLIKITDPPARFSLYLKKPHFLIKF